MAPRRRRSGRKGSAATTFAPRCCSPRSSDRFFEPALFLVRPDQTLYGSSVNSMPFARASIADLQTALSVIIQTQYPPRGLV